ncbi:MAG: hypothetical protein OXF85_01390 [Candidatus Saccharibacteria bacterium]|nr:hypothetical protein [Candidatus Saccharibacteria bacterium]MCY4010904.1 hypothetical protein [Candidatus Saccharibacteria bacterium]
MDNRQASEIVDALLKISKKLGEIESKLGWIESKLGDIARK